MSGSVSTGQWSALGPRLGLILAACGPLLAVSPQAASFYAPPKLLCLALGCLALWSGLAAARSDSPRAAATGLDAPLAACAAALLLSWAASDDRVLGFFGEYSLHSHGLLALGLCAALFYGAAASPERRDPLPFLRALVAAGAVAGLYGLLQRLGIEPIPGLPTEMLKMGRVASLQGNPVFLGASCAMLLPVALLLARGPSPGDRRLGRAGAFALGAALLLTLSRSAWLGAAAACGAQAVFLSPARLPSSQRLLRGLAGLALVAALAAGALNWGRGAALRTSNSERVQLWLAALRVARDHPWLGTGPEGLRPALGPGVSDDFIRVFGRRLTQSHAHNGPLHALATGGLLGLSAYLWLLWAAFRLGRGALAEPARRPLAAALSAGLLGLFAQSLLNPPPLACLALAAAFAGLLARGRPAAPARPVCLAAATLSLLAAAAILRLNLADRAQLRALRFHESGLYEAAELEYKESARLAPQEPSYPLGLARLYFQMANASSDAALRRELMQRAAAVGRDLAARRPGEAQGHQLLGTALTKLRAYGGPDRLDEAEAALDRALVLDRSLHPVLENRIALARMRGDAAKVAALESELARLKALAAQRDN